MQSTKREISDSEKDSTGSEEGDDWNDGIDVSVDRVEDEARHVNAEMMLEHGNIGNVIVAGKGRIKHENMDVEGNGSRCDDDDDDEEVVEAETQKAEVRNVNERDAYRASVMANLEKCRDESQAELERLRIQLANVEEGLRYPASETVKRHIKLLHEYNAIKDIGQGLLGLIAEGRGITMREVHNDFGVVKKD